MGELKPGWRRVKFGEIAEIVNDRVDDPSQAGVDRYVGLEHLDPESLTIRRWGTPDQVESTKLRFRAGDIIFGKRRAYQRKLAVADFEGICSAHAMVLRAKPDAVVPEFLPFFMLSDTFMERAQAISVGSLSPTINWRTLAAEEFVVPPHAEQKRLTERALSIERTRREWENCLVAAHEVHVPLFCTLTGLDPVENIHPILSRAKKVTAQGIPFRQIQDIGDQMRQGVQVGPFGGSVSSKHFVKDGVPVLKINNISAAGVLDLTNLIHLDPSQARNLSDRYSVQAGDVITAAQAVIGRTAIIPSSASGALISQHLIRIAVDPEKCSSEWLHMCFYTPLVLRQLHGVVQGGTRAGLNSNDVRSLVIPLPSLSEQEAILEHIRSVRSASAAVKERLKGIQQMQLDTYRLFQG